MGIIYIYLNTNEWKYYVGQTCSKFNKRHGNHLSSNKNVLFDNKLRAHLDQFIWTWFEVPNDELDDWECFLIARLNCMYPNGYNLTSGGNVNHQLSELSRSKIRESKLGDKNPNYGKHLSEETKAKIVESRKGYKHSDETRKKIGDANRGKVLSPEQREMISKRNRGRSFTDEFKQRCSERVSGEGNPMFGKHHSEETRKLISEHRKGQSLSEETRQKISEALKGRVQSEETRRKIAKSHTGQFNNPLKSKKVAQYTLDGNFIAEYPSCSEVGRSLGFCSGDISRCCNGKRRHVGGYLWKYVN